MKVLFLTNEYPPNIYGGAGIHVEYLTRELSRKMDVEVRCFGNQNGNSGPLKVKGYETPPGLLSNARDRLKSTLNTLFRDIQFTSDDVDADIVHCHTWYSHMAGILCKLLYGIPLVLTTHSLEPLRPWKVEQIGRGYYYSSWVEKTAIEMADRVIAVSRGTKEDILKHFSINPDRIAVIPNGIDINEFSCDKNTNHLEAYGIPINTSYILFVGRVTRQKGIIHLVNAIPHIDRNTPVVLCAGAPDTEEIEREMEKKVAEIRKIRDNVFWIREMLSTGAKIQLYSHAGVFCCPSIYEPFGIINLEAMACNTAVVASAVGGITEVVEHGKTGLVVPLEQDKTPPFEAKNPVKFAKDLASALNTLVADEPLRNKMAAAGRKRVENFFSWTSVADKTAEVYEALRKKDV
ncbi:MAG: glycogen synthase [Spirochaetales bacterium]|nr:glycogen synthase [Spirochaetales bacterium]